VTALEGTDVPLAFVWGMLDPVSGAHMAERIRKRLPGAPFLALDDVAHWPALEAPSGSRAHCSTLDERRFSLNHSSPDGKVLPW
jgi:pimeloyl-ACP methyl ester carboxylesterase